MSTFTGCRFCRRTDGDIISERVEGLRIRRGHVPTVTARHHQACLDAFVENEARLREADLAELRAALEAARAEAAR